MIPGVAKVQSLIDRCAAIEWRQPRHDPVRAAAAYQRWLAALGLRRRVRWIADPADVEAWQASQGAGADVWATIAANIPEGPLPSMVGLLSNSSPRATTVRWNLPSTAASEIAAKWTLVITAHMTAAEGALSAWESAWTEATASKPAIFWTIALLCPWVPFATPPMIAHAAVGALSACADRAVWAVLADALARMERQAGAEGQPVWTGKPQTQEEMIDALIAIAEPMIEACEAGAFAHTLLDEEIVVLASPSLFTDGRRVHRADGPAVAWPRTKLHAWKGVVVPEALIMKQQMITPDMIRALNDQRLRPALIDMYAQIHGHRRCLQDLGGVMMHEDRTGRLWCLNPARLLPQPGDLKLLEVTNGTAEPDGSRKTYWLNVPPNMQTARQAVAWTYGMSPEDYDGLVVRT